MTTGTKLHQTIGQLKSAAGDLQGFALDTDDPQAKQLFTSASRQLDQIVQQVSARTNYVEQQEPTYRMDHMAQGGGGQQGDQRARRGQTGPGQNVQRRNR